VTAQPAETSQDLVPRTDILQRAHELGIADELAADLIGLTATQVRAWRSTRTTYRLIPEDEELADAVRKVVRKGIETADWTLHFGTDDQKFRLSMLIMNRAASLIGVQGTTRVDELRAELQQLGAMMNTDDPDELEYDDEAPPGAFTFDPDDPR
jgi:hypothetical protein